jgi:predicted alpha/beta superfamily hydrolase
MIAGVADKIVGLRGHAATSARETCRMPDAIIPRAEMRDMQSGAGRAYRIFIGTPSGKAPPSGYPVLYLLDGNASFASAAVGVALQSRRPEVTGVTPAVVVGIGYPTDDYLDSARRTYDYTPSVPARALSPRADGSPWPPTGGADEFLDFLDGDLKPAIASEFPVDPDRQAIFGHSFGGLFVLHALFTRAGSFGRYVAASPSIWFGDCAILAEGDAFMARRPQTSGPDLLITVGEHEQAAVGAEAPAVDVTARSDWRQRNRMVENARELAQSLAGRSAINVTFREFAGENHSSSLLPAINMALRFALASGRST